MLPLADGKPNQHRPPNQFIAPVQEPYTYIIFRASEVKDLAVDEQVPPVQQHSVLDDPAVIGVRGSASFFSPLFLSSLLLNHPQYFWAGRSRQEDIAIASPPILSPSFLHS